ncbi:MAG: DNA polymerase ligase N-terminal domain-containing protein [Nitrososphaeria archaeon]
MPVYVVHEHWASTHHFDFRLEMDGVLKSWAVPKGVPTEPGVKRLAIAVEDHPLDYANFSGEIPEGEYGAGKVTIWDKGEYVVLEKSTRRIRFELRGERIRGFYQLIRFKKDKEREQWLLMKVSI